jgi:O-antigen/teichoic acid export membrane protein
MERLIALSRHIRQDSFLKNNVIYFVGSLTIAFLNYLYYPVMSRVLNVEEFGEMQTIFSLVFLSGVILTVFRMIVLNITANDTASEKSGTIPSLFTLSFLMHVPFILALFIGSPLLSHYFAFESRYAFSIFGLYILLSVYQTFYTAHLQGKKDFATLTISQIVGSAGKLIISFALVYVGFGVLGATFALVLVSLITHIYMRLKCRTFTLSFTPFKSVLQAIHKELPYATLVFVSLSYVTFLYSSDVLVVKRLFSPEEAGLYSGVATIARIIFFLTGSISGVLISSVTLANTTKHNHALLKKALMLILLIGGGALLFFTLFPVFVITLLVGAKYAPYAHYLPLMSLYLFIASLLNLLVSYLLALRSRALFPATIFGSVTLLVLVMVEQSSLWGVIASFTVSGVAALAYCVFAIYAPKRDVVQ